MTPPPGALTPALRDLLDRQQIVDLGFRYAKAIDDRDDALLRRCFTPDGVLSMLSLGDFVGIEAVSAALSHLAALDVTQHVISNQVIDIDGDRATMTSYIVATHIKSDHPGGSLFTAGGSYFDALARTPDGWRLVHRSARMLWSTGNAAMLFPH